MKESLVYIIILNWNGYKDTIECLESLKKITYRNYKIVLIDNGSTDESVKILKSKYPDLKLIENKTNLGFAGGCNVGIKYVLQKNAEYVLLLNNDTVVDKKFLTILVKSMLIDTEIGIAGPLIYYWNNTEMIWSSGSYKLERYNLKYLDIGYKKKDVNQFNRVNEVDFIWGCCLLIKTNIFTNVGLLNEQYFMYTEDKDFCIRVQNAGKKLIINPKSKIWHKVSSSSGGENNKIANYYMSRNNIYFIRTHFNGLIKFKFILFYIFDRFLIIISNFKNMRFNNVIMILYGTIHGLIGRTGSILQYKKT